MKSSYFWMCGVPKQCWSIESPAQNDRALGQLLSEAAVLERRLAKDVDLANTRSRYAGCCQQIERLVLARAKTTSAEYSAAMAVREDVIPAQRLDPMYLDFLVHARLFCASTDESLDPFLWRTVVSPNDIKQHAKTFAAVVERLGYGQQDTLVARQQFLDELTRLGCGFVELQWNLASPFEPDSAHTPADAQSLRHRTTSHRGEVAADLKERVDDPIENLRRRVGTALKRHLAVNMSDFNHIQITTVLQEYLCSSRGKKAAELRIAWADGSEGPRFPVYCVTKPEPLEQNSHAELHMELTSMRHVPLNWHVTMAWYRNVDRSRGNTLAEQDEHFYAVSAKQLKELHEAYRGKPLVLHMHHSGYEPAVVGFYRAIAESLDGQRSRRPWIRVVPHFHETQIGRPWPAADEASFDGVEHG